MDSARHSYPARAVNCLNADWPVVSNCCLQIMWATSMRQETAVGRFLAWAFAAINSEYFTTHRFKVA